MILNKGKYISLGFLVLNLQGDLFSNGVLRQRHASHSSRGVVVDRFEIPSSHENMRKLDGTPEKKGKDDPPEEYQGESNDNWPTSDPEVSNDIWFTPAPTSTSSPQKLIDYSLVDISNPTNLAQIQDESSRITEMQLPGMTFYLEMDYIRSSPDFESMSLYFKTLIEELLDMSSISMTYTLLSSPVNVQNVDLTPLTLFPTQTTQMIPTQLTVNSTVQLLSQYEISRKTEGPEDQEMMSLYFLEEAENSLSHSLMVYLTLWDCADITSSLEESCGLSCPRLVAIHLGNTEVKFTPSEKNFVPHQFQEETYSVTLNSAVPAMLLKHAQLLALTLSLLTLTN